MRVLLYYGNLKVNKLELIVTADRSTFKSNFVFNQNPAVAHQYEKMSKYRQSYLQDKSNRMAEVSKILDKGRESTLNFKGSEKPNVLRGNNSEQFYVQKVMGSEYLRHTIGPGKTKPQKNNEGDKGKIWRRILLWEFLGCGFR